MKTKSLGVSKIHSFINFIFLLTAISLPVATMAKTPDGQTPATETVCEDANLSAGLRGLCVAYGEANDCDTLSADSNKKACEQLEINFARQSGGQSLKDLFNGGGVSKVIDQTGGSVDFPNVATVIFPADAFAGPTTVNLSKTTSVDVAAAFDEFTSMFRPANRLAYEVRINTGTAPPVSDTVRVELSVPEAFQNAVPSDYQIELFAQVVQDGGEETIDIFELFPANFDATRKVIWVDLPTATFSDSRNTNATFEAIITLAPTPGINRTSTSTPLTFNTLNTATVTAAATAGKCKAAGISCPLGRGCDVTSPYNPARKHPVTGETRPHYGTDYRAPNGSDVRAAANGTVERSYLSSSYGETIVVRHSDGSASLYAHMENRTVDRGDTVTKGSSMGTSDNTGLSSGPHLHFEYVPNGQIIQSKNRIDPDACVDVEGSGSINVRDNGSLADDAFSVYLDNVLIGSTTIGASNTFSVSNLIPGNHALRVTAIIAPDNVGTYLVTLGDGLKFSDGSTTRSGVIPQGGSANFTITVPDQP